MYAVLSMPVMRENDTLAKKDSEKLKEEDAKKSGVRAYDTIDDLLEFGPEQKF